MASVAPFQHSQEHIEATNYKTLRHVEKVRNCINLVIRELLDRQEAHDQSKMREPEVGYFAEYTDKLEHSTYGSPEYEQFRKELRPALDHHYAVSRHHPEHFRGGVSDMNLIDLIEMYCDWKAATLRHNDGNMEKSIDHNAMRFALSPQLAAIFKNSIHLFDEVR